MQTPLAPSLRLLVVGLNYRTAPLELREALAFSPARLPEALGQLRREFPEAEFVILSTCNRVELYLSRPVGDEPRLEHLAQFLADFHRVPLAKFQQHLYHHADRNAVEHLFRVTASLDSMVVGETQILAQVKQAYQQACAHGAVGGLPEKLHEHDASVFHTLFQRALAAAKAVLEETQLASGRVSVASVAVDLASSVFDRFDDKTVLCIGAGKMAGLVVRRLRELGPKRILVTNRSDDRAVRLAEQFHATPMPFAQLDDCLVQADIIVTGTGSAEPIISAARFKNLLKPRRYRPVVMMDLAVPRDVEAAVGGLNNVYLYNIDDLEHTTAESREKRGTQIEQSQRLLQERVEEFIAWYGARDIGPLVKALFEQFHSFAHAEIADFFAKNPHLDAHQRHDIERMAHRMVGKMLHGPVSHMTHHAHVSARPMLATAIKKLFGLQEGGAVLPEREPNKSSQTLPEKGEVKLPQTPVIPTESTH